MAAEGSCLFARIAAAGDGDAPAFVDAHGVVPRRVLLAAAARLAGRLGVARRGPVVLYGHKQPAMVAGMLAALRLGRAYVPIDRSSPPDRVARMLAVARPDDAVLAEPPPADVGRALAAHGIVPVGVDRVGAPTSADAAAADVPPATPSADAIAYVVFTSGTTGDPKGVPVPHGALAQFTDWLLATHAFTAGETFLNQAPFGFDLSVMDVYGALLTGGALFTLDRDETADPRRLFRRLDGAPLTTWVSTPSFVRLCLAEPRFAQAMLPALRRFLFCGETLPPAVVRALHARFPAATVWNLYGPTETTVAVTAVAVGPALAASGDPLPVGRPGPGTEIRVVAPDGGAQPPGVRGEIVVVGGQVAAGYLGEEGPGASGRFFTLADGRRAYRTGDLGHVDAASGLLHCAGRVDRQIKLNGHRLELEEIEVHLRAVAGVVDAAVLAVERDGRADHLLAFVVSAADGAAADAARVRAALATRLPAYAVPRFVRRVATLPLTAQGKIDRRALRELAR